MSATFESLGLSPILLKALTEAGYTQPTTVQEQAIPAALAGQDLMVSSQTGSGKTAAFMLPALHALSQPSDTPVQGVRILVLTPTRELALQVTQAVRTYGRHINRLQVATVVGGMPYGLQIKQLSQRVDVLVATPGRLLDHLNAGRVRLSNVSTLVLDEADRMLDMGFIDDIESIVSKTPVARQTLLFSATLDGIVSKLAARLLRDPVRIDVAGARDRHQSITQHLMYADDMGHKSRLLDHLLRGEAVKQAIVFTATKRAADQLAEDLTDRGFIAAALHGDMNQRQRTRTLTQMQQGRVQVLVATDVAARGIDVEGISHVINFDLPKQAEDYVHRIGRTGRAGREGLAFTLATQAERHQVKRIERYTSQDIPIHVIAGLEPRREVRRDADSERRPRSNAQVRRPTNERSGSSSRSWGAARESSGGTGSWGSPRGAASRDQGDSRQSPNRGQSEGAHTGSAFASPKPSGAWAKPRTDFRPTTRRAPVKSGWSSDR